MTIHSARKALQENINLLDPAKHRTVRNMNIALLEIMDRIDKIEEDLHSLHNKIQPILKDIQEDYDIAREETGRY